MISKDPKKVKKGMYLMLIILYLNVLIDNFSYGFSKTSSEHFLAFSFSLLSIGFDRVVEIIKQKIKS